MAKTIYPDNITEYLTINAQKYPDKPAILHPSIISFKDLDEEVDRFAAGLLKSGISKGCKTILLVSSGPDFFTLCFALLRIGAIPIMIDPGMGTRAMIKALSGTEAKAFIGIPKAHLLKYIFPSAFREVKIWIHTGQGYIPGASKYSDLRASKIPTTIKCKLDPDEIAGIFFTSGSTGPPKGVIYHARTMYAQVSLMEQHFKYGPDEIDLCTFPLLGLFVTCLGSSLVIADMNPLKPAELNPENLISNINDFQCTRMFGSPMIIKRLERFSQSTEVEMKSLKKVISAGAPVPVELIDAFLKLLGPDASVHTPYGATEALPVSDIDSNEISDIYEENNTYMNGICVGNALPGLIIRIIKITDKPISEWSDNLLAGNGEIGEIIVKGPLVSKEYYNNPLANTMGKIPDNSDNSTWHRMGDLGRMDAKGKLWFYGRKNHRVITNNGTLFTIPTEAIFNSHPDVFRAALVGIPVKDKKEKIPLIYIQPEHEIKNINLPKLKRELFELSKSEQFSSNIEHILFHHNFPVDPRHNAKIFREKLASWAERRIR